MHVRSCNFPVLISDESAGLSDADSVCVCVCVCVCLCVYVCVYVCVNLYRLGDRLWHNLHIKEINSLNIEEVQTEKKNSNRTTGRGCLLYTLIQGRLEFFFAESSCVDMVGQSRGLTL